MSGKHHKYGPSTLDALSKCVRFKYDETQDEDAASEGTELHAAAETGNTAGLDDEQARCVDSARSYAEFLKFEDGADPADWEDLREVRLELKDLTHGTADRVLINRKLRRIHVVDYKFTRIENDHALQLRAYGAALVEKMLAESGGVGEWSVAMHVVAPRLANPTEREEAVGSLLLPGVRAEIEALYERIEDPFVEATPHEDLCRKCGRAGTCPKLRGVALAVAPSIGLPLPGTFDIDAATPRDRAIMQVLAGALVQLAEKWKKSNADAVAGGLEIPGFKLTTRSTGLRLAKANAAEFARRMEERHGLAAVDLLACANISVNDVCDAIAMTKGMTAADAKEDLKTHDTDILSEGKSQFLSKEKRLSDLETLAMIAGAN